MLAYVGLTRPYRFERAIVVVLAFVMAIAVLLTMAIFVATGDLTAFGPRAHYFLYLIVLLALAVVLVRWPWIAGALLMLAVVDFGWGVSSYLLRHDSIGAISLLPPDKAEPGRFQWHALLQAVPVPSLQFTSATGLSIRHTSEGTRGKDPAPGSLKDSVVVATFGGSTTYDIGAAEGDTWSDRLGQALGGRFFVVNHGVPGYTTVEHLIQTAFYQTKFGKPPSCATYYVGWNDLRNAHIPRLDSAYADFHLPSQVDSLKTRRIGGSHVTISPVLTVVLRAVSANTDTVRYFADPYAGEPSAADDPAL